MDAKFIQQSLENYFYDKAKFIVPNIYFFCPSCRYGETDLLIVRNNGFMFDFEVKISRGDYKADFKKKRKHSILSKGWYKNAKGTKIDTKDSPNRFYFAVPKGLITKKDLPKYAGLFYINKDGSVEKIKEAKLLHKNKISYWKRLCTKFYFYWKNCNK